MTLAASFNPPFVTNNGGTLLLAEAALFAGLQGERAYLNIHLTFRPGGEIRGFFHQVPEPGSLALLGLGLFGLAGMQAKRRAPSWPALDIPVASFVRRLSYPKWVS